MVTFTGSPEVGESIVKMAGLKKVTMVFGSNSCAIVLDDADLADAAAKTRAGGYAVAGQLVVVVKCRDLDHALELANTSKYGLQAGVFTANLNHALRAVREIDVGGVIVNDVPTFRVDPMPYGGVKLSGIGREGPKYAIEEMTEIRLVAFQL